MPIGRFVRFTAPPANGEWLADLVSDPITRYLIYNLRSHRCYIEFHRPIRRRYLGVNIAPPWCTGRGRDWSRAWVDPDDPDSWEFGTWNRLGRGHRSDLVPPPHQ